MTLTEALAVRSNDVVTFVGAGGKTTAMFRLAQELAAAGRRVVATTTTRIFAEQIRHAPHVIMSDDEGEILSRLPSDLEKHRIVLVVRGVIDQDRDTVDKADGVPPELVARMRALVEVDAVVIEGDGCRRRSFKAPAAHEPVVPACTTILVPVVGIDILGQPLTDNHVHRAERAAALADVPLGATITPEIVARVIVHPEGGAKNKPPGARLVPLINKVETAEQSAIAGAIAKEMCADRAVNAVCIGAVARVHPIVRAQA